MVKIARSSSVSWRSAAILREELNARKVLDEYGGAFLSDVVGLGKTYMSALLAQQLNEPCLVIAPPHLLDAHSRAVKAGGELTHFRRALN